MPDKFFLLFAILFLLIILKRVLFSLPRILRWVRRRKALGRSFVTRAPRVIDGDTIEAEGKRIRLYGIDAPEMGQAQGDEARRALMFLLKDQRIKVVPMDIDQYGRLVARLTVKGHDVARRMVAEGYALSCPSRNGPNYDRDERRAKRRDLGLWEKDGIEDPGTWRTINGVGR